MLSKTDRLQEKRGLAQAQRSVDVPVPAFPASEGIVMPDSTKISIVTPSFNQAPFLEQTICSVLNQQGADIEYIIMDGGSGDGSVGIIRKYEDRLAHWESAPDKGQADAVYRGFEKATGEIIAWLNSDDYYFPGTLARAVRTFERHPEAELLIGGCLTVDPGGNEIYRNYGFPFTFEALLHWGCRFNQPASFWKREAFFEAGGFDRSLRHCFDYDMYLRLAKRRPAIATSRILAAFRSHPTSKTNTQREVKHAEDRLLWERYGRFDVSEAESRRLARRYARAHALRKSMFLALDAFTNPAMAMREIRRRARVLIFGEGPE
jgi:glycosyltransferase involved in cell wall biosynthesis